MQPSSPQGSPLPEAAKDPWSPIVYGPARDDAAGGERGAEQPSDALLLDARTGPEGILHYEVTFDPSVVPFKRGLSRDVVRPDYGLAVGEGELEPVEIPSGAVAVHGALFWGRVAVEFEPGQPVAIPTVAPTSRILAVETIPPLGAPLQAWRDTADNLYVEADAEAHVELHYLVEAPPTWFGRRALPKVPLTAGSEGLARRLSPLPEPVRTDALEVARRIGIDRTHMRWDEALVALVAWFRSFEAAPLRRPAAGSLYRAIALAQRGVCRHRAHAFTITARALGIAARYVDNEAHAFVEVWVPPEAGPPGWLRVDLGGGAEGLAVHDGKDVVRYAAPEPDPFPQPELWRASYSARASRQPAASAGASAVWGLPPMAHGPSWHAGSDLTPGDLPWQSLVGVTGAIPGARTLVLTLDPVEPKATRGGAVEVSGRVVDATGAGVANVPVVAVLAPPGHGPPPVGRPLGGALSSPSGHFSARVFLPPDIPPGPWRIVVVAPATATTNPAWAE